jgi:hypothetical protein
MSAVCIFAIWCTSCHDVLSLAIGPRKKANKQPNFSSQIHIKRAVERQGETVIRKKKLQQN